MATEIPKPVSPEDVETTAWMQRACIDAYLTVAASFQAGMTELAIERAIRAELKSRLVRDYWYDIPVMVLVGVDRFMQMADRNYDVKRPSPDVTLTEGSPVFIDMHPRYGKRWGNFAATSLFRQTDEGEAVTFLQYMQRIQKAVIRGISDRSTGNDVAQRFLQEFHMAGIQLVDVRGNFGHSMGFGAKHSYQRLFLDRNHLIPMGGGIYGIEPGGYKKWGKRVLVARFEDCVHIPPYEKATLLGRDKPVPTVFENR